MTLPPVAAHNHYSIILLGKICPLLLLEYSFLEESGKVPSLSEVFFR